MKSTPRSSPVLQNQHFASSAMFMWTVGICVVIFLSVPLSLAEQVAAPVISPPAGEYSPDPVDSGNLPVELTMTSATEGAVIYYIVRDTDAGDILTYLPPYDPANKPGLAAPGTKYVRARALKDGMEQSELVSQQYVIHAPVIEMNGYQMGFGKVILTETATGAILGIWNRGDLQLKIFDVTYTIDGVPVEAGVFEDNFTAPIELSQDQQYNLNIQFTPTEIRSYSATVTIVSNAVSGKATAITAGSGYDPTKVEKPTITLTGGEIHYSPQVVLLQCPTAEATLYYTLDSSDPTKASNLYDPVDRITLTEFGEVVLKVRGYKDALTPSDIETKTFTVVELELTANQDFYFDQIKVGESKTLPLVLTNEGSRPIDITLIEIDDENFTVDWAGPVTIPVGGSKEYVVQFSPLTRFDLDGKMTISNNSSTGDIYRFMMGFGLASDYGVDPASKNVGGEGEVYTVWVALAGSWTATEVLDWVSIVARPDFGTVVVTVSPNATGEIRAGNIGIGGKTHSIVQSYIDPLMEGAPVEGLENWFLSEWFGYYNTTLAPWLFHAQHGFIFRYPKSTNANLYVYDNAMGCWWWTRESSYPSLYVFDPPADTGGTDIEAAWLYYFEGTQTPRSFGVLSGSSAGVFLFFNP